MTQWVKTNVAAILTLAGMVVYCLFQWNHFEQAAVQTWKNDAVIQGHLMDTRRHIDFDRDERRWQEMNNWMERMERKVDEIRRDTR